MRSSINNPFVNCTARDMSCADVMQYWCSPYECYRINERDLVASLTPIILEGARGSGKTMILKHLSFFCQKEMFGESDILKQIEELGYLGVYFRYSADYSSLFDSLNCNMVDREFLFNGYFQLCMCLEISRIIQTFENELLLFEKDSLFKGISAICGEDVRDAKEFKAWIEKSIRSQDALIRKSHYSSLYIKEDVISKTLLFELLEVLRSTVASLNKVLFVLTVDEYENIGDYQRVINTYIKQLDGRNNYTFRIGVRPEGVKDYSTNVSGEFLQDGRDFIKKQLVVNHDDKKKYYSKFVQEVINCRLKNVPMFEHAGITIDRLLGNKENYELEAKTQIAGRKTHISELFAGKTEEEKEKIIEIVSDENPLIEAYFIMRIKRGETLEAIKRIREEVRQGKKTSDTKKFHSDYVNKYKPALLFWLLDKYKLKKMYYSYSTYLYLSCGSIYDFIGLCRTVFDELESDYFSGFEKEPTISRELQTRAAEKYAISQLDKVRINHEHGPKMHQFVQNMCSLFSYYHKGDLSTTYPETNQFFISGNFDSTGINKEIWKSLIRWGVVVKKQSFQRASVSVSSRAQLYYINKLYYPPFGISCRIRGGFNIDLTNNMWDRFIISAVDPSSLVKAGKKSINNVPQEEDFDERQYTFFDAGEDDE